jgi:hypothetical protein
MPVVVLRVTVRAADLDTFITRYSRHLAGDRIFIFSKTPQPVGTRVRFSLQLASGDPLISGKGTVTRMVADTGDKRHPPGMELAFVPLDERSQTLVDFMMATRAGMTEDVGVAPAIVRAVVPPTPPKIDSLPPPLPPPPDAPAAAAKADAPAAPPKRRDQTPAGKTTATPGREPTPAKAKGARADDTPPGVKPNVQLKPEPTPDKPQKPESKEKPRRDPTPAHVRAKRDKAAGIIGSNRSQSGMLNASRAAPRIRKMTPMARVRPPSISLEVGWRAEADVPSSSATEGNETTRPGPVGYPGITGDDDKTLNDKAPSMPANGNGSSDFAPGPANETPALNSLAVLAAVFPTQSPPPPPLSSPQTPPAAAPGSPPAPTVPVVATPAPGDAASNPLAARLAEALPPTLAHPMAPGEAPAMAEGWHGDAPANPFSDVSNDAIEYFVEWSLESSIGPHPKSKSRFSDVPMALPDESDRPYVRPPRWQRVLLIAAPFALGAVVAAIAISVLANRHTKAVVAAAVASAKSVGSSSAEKPRDADVTITSKPSGAMVMIDGETLGETPLTTQVSAGSHQVVVSKDRYSMVSNRLEAPGKLALELRRPTATLHITSVPAEAEVIVAGQPRGKSPVDLKLPGFETYEVRVVAEGMRVWRKPVYLNKLSNRLEATLVAKPPPAPPRKPKK